MLYYVSIIYLNIQAQEEKDEPTEKKEHKIQKKAKDAKAKAHTI